VAEIDGVDYWDWFNSTSSSLDQKKRFFNSDRREPLRKSTKTI
jgi:hypothetical protein